MPQADHRSTTRSVAIIGTRGYPSYYGGFETAVRKLAPYLADRGWDVTVYGREGAVAPDDIDLDPRVRSVITRGIDTKSFSTLSYGFFSALDAMRRKPDLAIVMNVANGFILPLLAMRGIPTLVNVDGIEWERAKWGRIAKAVFKLGAHAAARWGSRLVYDSEEIARRWHAEFRRDGDFIPYGGDTRDPLPVEPGLTSREYALYVARFVPENSVAEFFDAAERLAVDTDVVIVGSSGYGSDFDDHARELAAREPRVRWLGHVSDDDRLHALWQHAGAYFHGHSVGGTNPALVQAMALGAPVIARDTVYNREVLGEAAVFTQPDAIAIAAAVRQVLTDTELQTALAEGAAERAVGVYTWDVVNALYENSLMNLAEARIDHRAEGHASAPLR
ncbi:glycosyltransferase [Microbacterium rhizophilus]|uniref:glycosyltransferase n=1 Tax=Microbacterium rhizophilus TaxID=3138934 RepID=UPI0031EA5992